MRTNHGPGHDAPLGQDEESDGLETYLETHLLRVAQMESLETYLETHLTRVAPTGAKHDYDTSGCTSLGVRPMTCSCR